MERVDKSMIKVVLPHHLHQISPICSGVFTIPKQIKKTVSSAIFSGEKLLFNLVSKVRGLLQTWADWWTLTFDVHALVLSQSGPVTPA